MKKFLKTILVYLLIGAATDGMYQLLKDIDY